RAGGAAARAGGAAARAGGAAACAGGAAACAGGAAACAGGAAACAGGAAQEGFAGLAGSGDEFRWGLDGEVGAKTAEDPEWPAQVVDAHPEAAGVHRQRLDLGPLADEGGHGGG